MFALVNQFLSKYFGLGILVALGLALIFPYVAFSFSPYGLYILFLLMFLSGFNIDWSKLKVVVKKPKLVILGNSLLYIVLPLIVFVFAKNILTDEQYVYGAVFAALTPAAAVAPFFCNVFKSNKELSFLVLVTSMILSPIIIPVMLTLLVGNYLNISGMLIFKDILVLVPAPLLLAALTKKFFKKGYNAIQTSLPLLNFLLLTFLIFIQFGSSMMRLHLHYLGLRNLLGILFIVFIQDFSLLLFLKPLTDFLKNREDAIAIFASSSMKNIAIASTILLLYSPKAALSPALGFVAHAFLFTPIILMFLINKSTR